jgi:hypothetical protein
MVQIIIKKSLFDDYFNLLYKIEYDYLKGKESSSADYDQIDKIKFNIKESIKKTLSNSINRNDYTPLNYFYHRLNYVDFEECGRINTKWISTYSKTKLYRYLLFEPNDSTNLSECIDYWFSEGYGYWPDNSRTKSNHQIQDQLININVLDPIGSILKMKIRINNLDLILSEEEIKEIYTWEFNSNDTNKIKYSKYLGDLDKFFPTIPSVYKIKDEEYYNLIDIFDIFFSYKKNHDIYSNPKINGRMWIEESDKFVSDIIQLDKTNESEESDNESEESDNESDNESWITEIKTNVKPIQFIKKIKKQIEKLCIELKSTDNSGQRELKDNFLTDLYIKLNEFCT